MHGGAAAGTDLYRAVLGSLEYQVCGERGSEGEKEKRKRDYY